MFCKITEKMRAVLVLHTNTARVYGNPILFHFFTINIVESESMVILISPVAIMCLCHVSG